MTTFSNWPILVIGGAILYCATNVLSGDQGLAKWSALQQSEQELKAELADAQQELSSLEDRAARLKGKSIDLDLVDERARALLGYASSDEVVFFLNKAADTVETP